MGVILAVGVCVWDGLRVGLVGVVGYGAVSAYWGWWCFLLGVGCGGGVVWGWKGNFRTPSVNPLTNAPEMGYNRGSFGESRYELLLLCRE